MNEFDDELIQRRLGSLSHAQLVERLVSLARRDDALRLALLAEAEAGADELDVRKLRKQLTVRLRVSDRTYDRRYARRYAGEVDEALDVVAALLDGGHAAAAVELAEHCMKRLDTALRHLDDSGGYVGVGVDRLKELHHDACVRAGLDPAGLARRLADWALAGDSDWEWFLDSPTRYADVLGDEGLEAFRQRVEPEWQKLPALQPSREPIRASWDSRRFRVTYVREGIARAGGSVDELVSVLAHDLSSPRQFERIADALEARRSGARSARLARTRKQDPRACRASGSAARIVAAYLRDGQVDDAVALAVRAHTHAPSTTTYLELRTAAEALGDWPERRHGALERLRGADRFGGRSSAVRAQLAEGDLDGAWADANEAGCDDGTWLELADASRQNRPDEPAASTGGSSTPPSGERTTPATSGSSTCSRAGARHSTCTTARASSPPTLPGSASSTSAGRDSSPASTEPVSPESEHRYPGR